MKVIFAPRLYIYYLLFGGIPHSRHTMVPNSNERQQHVSEPDIVKVKICHRLTECVTRAGYDLITRRYKRKMERGSIAQKRGSIVLPLYIYTHTHTCVAGGRQRCTVDRNRAAIKSYLSYCYLGRNSPQVGIGTSTREWYVRSASHDDRSQHSLSLAPPFVRTHCREICAQCVRVLTGYILMVGFLRMRLPSHLSFNPAEQSCKRPKENGVELGERVYPISQVGSLNFRHSWFVDPLVSWPERKRIGEARPIALRRRNELCK